MLNSVVLAGNLGNDPEIHFSTSGEPVASFNLAFKAGKGMPPQMREVNHGHNLGTVYT